MEKQPLFKRPWVQTLLGIVIILLIFIGLLVYKSLSSRVSIDRAVIEAPIITINPQAEGVLQTVYVKEGDTVTKGETVAQVGSETLAAGINGIVISTQNVPGQVFVPGLPGSVVSMIDPTELRVVATVDENKGLSDIHVGDPVAFTVDAFGSQTFTGVVESISPTSNDSSAAFTISDKREVRQFNIKIRFDIAAHPEFKNGMSAKVKIYPKK
jgi:multidrug resistance efflux pump